MTYTTAHSNAGSLTCWARAGIKPATSWFLVGFISAAPRWELLLCYRVCIDNLHKRNSLSILLIFFKLLSEFYYIYSCTMIITCPFFKKLKLLRIVLLCKFKIRFPSSIKISSESSLVIQWVKDLASLHWFGHCCGAGSIPGSGISTYKTIFFHWDFNYDLY